MIPLPPELSERPALKMRHLVLLGELGKHGTIAQAAKAVHLSQPAASKLLGELEQVLGVQLFERSARGVEPTWYGTILLRRARAALGEMEAAHQEIHDVMTGLRGHVRVGAILTPAVSLVPQAIVRLQADHPAVKVSVTVDTSLRLLQALQREELDIVVGRAVLIDQLEQLRVEPVADEPHGLLARANHPLLDEHPITLASVARQGWIMPPAASILRARLQALFLAGAIEPPRDIVETSALPVVSSLIMRSDMLVALPPPLLQPYLDTGMIVVLPFELGITMDCYGIITRRGRELQPAAQSLLAMLRQQSAQGFPGPPRSAPV
jgi:DNA-binding transcriptional LysR family regulator